MSLTVVFACLAIVFGQALIARRCYTFLQPSIGISCMSPFVAWVIASLYGPKAFVIGYLVGNLVLFVVSVLFARAYFSTS